MLGRLSAALERGLVKEIFDHIRNYLMCAFLLTIGTSQFNQKSDLIMNFAPEKFGGYGIIGVSIILMILNLIDGIRKISKSKNHLLWSIVLVSIYIFVSMRIIEMAWQFRELSSGIALI